MAGNIASPSGSWSNLVHDFFGSIRVHTPDGFSVASAVSAQLMVLTNRQGVVGRGRGGPTPPLFSTGGTRPQLPPPLFGLKFVQKLVHCCNWLLTETQCKIISVQHVCRPKLFKNLCSSLVSGIPHFFFRITPLPIGMHIHIQTTEHR